MFKGPWASPTCPLLRGASDTQTEECGMPNAQHALGVTPLWGFQHFPLHFSVTCEVYGCVWKQKKGPVLHEIKISHGSLWTDRSLTVKDKMI